MNALSRPFSLDKRNGKLAGVCSGIAAYTGWDVTLIRIVTFIGTILAWGGLALVYIAIALIAPSEQTA